MLNRGVDKRTIFLDNQDRARFVHDMFVFNNRKPTHHVARLAKTAFNMSDLRSRTYEKERLVDIHGWVLMDNHYHLLLSEKVEGGLTLFIRRLNIGYSKYFNEKYRRSGTLFQGRTKKILIDNDAYFLHILNYIHFNPLDLLSDTKEWRKRRIKSTREALRHLAQYRWSSYLDYTGTKNFPSILTTDLFRSVFGDYGREAANYLRDISEQDLGNITLE